MKSGMALALCALTALAAIAVQAQAADSAEQIVPRKRGDSTGTAEVLRELYLGNLTANRVQARPVPWLPGTPTELFDVNGHRLQFHNYSSPASASAAKSAMLKRLPLRRTKLVEPSHVTRCGSDLVLEFGPGDAMIGAADQTCEHPINIPAFVKIERDRDAAKLLRLLAQHGSPRQAFDVWSPFFGREPGFAYTIPSGYLYVHVSPTSAQAEQARQQWADQTQNEFPQNRQWAHRCGRAIVVYDHRQGRGLNALLQRQCGAAVIGRAVVRD
jgi:hypothetical protein